MESRTQGSRPRPRTQKKSEAKAKDSLSEDRHSRGQEQERSMPRTKDTSASALRKKKKVFTKIFQAISTKKRFPKIFQVLHKILTIQKILLSSSRGQANFRGLDLRGQGQGLQNVFSRTSSRPRTSSRTPPLAIILGLSNNHNKTVANLVTAKMLHCYMLVNTLQMYTLNSTYSPIKSRIPDKLGPCLNFFLEMYKIY